MIIAVPGPRNLSGGSRMKRWAYPPLDRADLTPSCIRRTLMNSTVWSIGVPTINMLFNISLRMVARALPRPQGGKNLSSRPRPAASGDTTWKTVFPYLGTNYSQSNHTLSAVCDSANVLPDRDGRGDDGHRAGCRRTASPPSVNDDGACVDIRESNIVRIATGWMASVSVAQPKRLAIEWPIHRVDAPAID